MGYTNVREFKGGKQEWIDAGLPIDGKYSQPKSPTERSTVNATTTPDKDAA